MTQSEREVLIHKYHTLAASMQKDIDSKLDSGTSKQRPTPRRARIIDSQRRDAERLTRVQRGLRALATHLSTNDDLPQLLTHLTSRKAVEECLSGYSNEAAQNALMKLIDNHKDLAQLEADAKMKAETEEKALLAELIGAKIPGFWPTPATVVRTMAEQVQIHFEDNAQFIQNRTMTMLEPSAGIGDIARGACDFFSNEMNAVVHLTMIERNYRLFEILNLRHRKEQFADSTVIQREDFLDLNLNDKNGISPFIGKYKVILMNPPFENGADIDHVRHAFDNCLDDGGILVAIMGEGAFFRTEKKAVEFREWLEFFQGTSEKLPDGTFDGGQFRSTGVATRMVILTNE